MLKDITLGQYFPLNSCVHKLDPRFKIIITGIFMSMVFSAKKYRFYDSGIPFCFDNLCFN